jgi:hypothetical protein
MTDVFPDLAGLPDALGGSATAVAAGLDHRFGALAPVVAGAAAALAVAIAMAIYFRGGYRSRREMVRHGAAAIVVLGLLALVASDMRHAALAYLGINPSKPAVGLEIRLPKAAALDLAGKTPAGLQHQSFITKQFSAFYHQAIFSAGFSIT